MHWNLKKLNLMVVGSLLGFVMSHCMAMDSAAIAQPKTLPTISLQDLPRNLFESATCDRNISIPSQNIDASQVSLINTFCFQRVNHYQDEFILGTIVCHGCDKTKPSSPSFTTPSPQPLPPAKKAITGIDSQTLTEILNSIDLRYHNPLTWSGLQEFTIGNLGDGSLGLSAHGESRNGNYKYFRILVFGREQILVVLVTSHSSLSSPVLDISELAYSLDRRLVQWLTP
jgi:hypothetical protein